MVLTLGRRAAPKQPLSPVEMNALCSVANDKIIGRPMYKRLQKLGFVEQKSGRWGLTHQGQIQMIFRGAR